MLNKQFIQETTKKIPKYRNSKIWDYLTGRFVEKFGTDEIVSQYIATRGVLWDRDSYVKRLIGKDGKGMISLVEYFQWLYELRNSLPKRLINKDSDAWIQLIATNYGPYTFEQRQNVK